MNSKKTPFSAVLSYNGIVDFFTNNPNRIFRYSVYRRMFTPQETDKKYSDQSFFESTYINTGMVREVIPLPDGDVMLGIAAVSEDISDMSYLEYFRLSEIRLSYWPKDDAEYGASDEELEVKP